MTSIVLKGSLKLPFNFFKNSVSCFIFVGYILHYRMDDSHWQETHLTGDRTFYTLHDLQCGTTYSFYLVAFNSAGRGNGSEIISAKTDGSRKYYFKSLKCLDKKKVQYFPSLFFKKKSLNKSA